MNGDPRLVLRLFPHAALPGFRQTLAGLEVLSDTPLTPLAYPGAHLAAEAPFDGLQSWRIDYHGPALSEGKLQKVLALSAPPLHRIRYDDGETFLIHADGTVARETADSEPGEHSLERILGAPLALLLAWRARYLLHASAIEVAGRAIALVGESGAGKSTLARAASEAGLPRLADDQLPVRLGAQPAALPHFPQLKLPPSSWYPEPAPAELPLSAIVTFGHGAEETETRLRRLDGAAACLVLVRATVASRLFAPELLEAHFAAAAAATRHVAVWELRFPSGVEGLQHAISALEELA